eukprot:2667617-Rhodomonas_salina.1
MDFTCPSSLPTDYTVTLSIAPEAGVGMPELSGLRAWVEQNRDTYPQGSAGPMCHNRRHQATWNPLRRPTRPNVAQVTCDICLELHNTRQCRLRGAITEAISEWRDRVFRASQTVEARRAATENLISTELTPGLVFSENRPPQRNPRRVSWVEPAGARVSDQPEPAPLSRVALSAESMTARTTKCLVERPRPSQMGRATLHDTAPGERIDMAAGAQPVTQCSAVPAAHSPPNTRNVRSCTEQREAPTLGLERESVRASGRSRQQIARVMFTGSGHGGKTTLIKSIVNCYQTRPNTAVMIVDEASTAILRSFGSGALEKLVEREAARITENDPSAHVLTLFDRGIADGLGFVPYEQDWYSAANDVGVGLDQSTMRVIIRAPYDTVLHMESLSAARLVSEQYQVFSPETNTVRTQDANAALRSENRLRETYSRLSQTFFVQATERFDDKLRAAMDIITKRTRHVFDGPGQVVSLGGHHNPNARGMARVNIDYHIHDQPTDSGDSAPTCIETGCSDTCLEARSDDLATSEEMSPIAGQGAAGEEADPNIALDVSTPLTESINPPPLIRLVITGPRESGKTSIMEVLRGSIPALTQGQMR